MKFQSVRSSLAASLIAIALAVASPAPALALGKSKTASPALTEVSQARATANLRVASYNVWGLPRPLLQRPSRLEDIHRMIPGAGADVIGFQEIFSRLTYILADIPGYPYVAWGFRKDGAETMQGDGLLIVSRWPILETKTIRYSKCSGTDCVSRKGALMARVLVDGIGEVDVYNTHLNAGGKEEVRIVQIRELLAFIEQNSPDNPVILTGDFNASPGSEEYREVVEGGAMRDAHNEFRTYNPVDSTVHWNGYTMDPKRNQYYKFASWFVKPRRIDYIWLKDDDQTTTQVVDSRLLFDYKVNGRHLSDHFGVVMDLVVGIN